MTNAQTGTKGFVKRPLAERLWEKVSYEGDCWVWTASCNHTGYGYLWNGERKVVAHRLAYELIRGQIPDGLVLDHLCRNRLCVNPAHLEPVTHAENMRRGDCYGSGWKRLLTHCKNGHPYSPENTRIVKGGTRECRKCAAVWRKRGYELRKLAAQGSDRHG